jgi:hypothetical protein
MVHALKEAWRVLAPRGVMVDLRPLCLDAPLDILFNNNEKEFAGVVDMSLDIDAEVAADRAIEEVLSEGYFKELTVERFEIAYYWDTVRGMIAEIRNRWKDDAIIEENIIQRAYELFKKRRGHKKVRMVLEMKLVKYEKLNLPSGF